MNAPFAPHLLRGSLQTEAISNPAAGAEISWTTPSNFMIEILYLRFRLVTSAAAPIRQVTIGIYTPTAVITWRSAPVILHNASTTYDYNVSTSGFEPIIIITPTLQLNIPPNHLLREAWTIGTATLLLDAADQFSAINIVYVRHAIPNN